MGPAPPVMFALNPSPGLGDDGGTECIRASADGATVSAAPGKVEEENGVPKPWRRRTRFQPS